MGKRGRPLVDDSRKHSYTLHLNDDEFEILMKIVHSTGKRKADILRTGLELYFEEIVEN